MSLETPMNSINSAPEQTPEEIAAAALDAEFEQIMRKKPKTAEELSREIDEAIKNLKNPTL